MKPTAAPGPLLLCLDLQPAFLGVVPDAGRLLRRCAFAIGAARALGLPVAFTEQVPQKLGGTAPELLALADSPAVWGKTAFSALADDGIADALRARAVDHLILCGIETPVCVYQTALDALEAHLLVTVLTDCVGARRAGDAAAALAALAQAGVHVLPAETVYYAILRDTTHPAFRAYTQLVKNHA